MAQHTTAKQVSNQIIKRVREDFGIEKIRDVEDVDSVVEHRVDLTIEENGCIFEVTTFVLRFSTPDTE